MPRKKHSLYGKGVHPHLRIAINIPEGFMGDEIIINLNREEPLPFSDGKTNEELVEELTPVQEERLNATMNYYMANMNGDVEIEELEEFGGDIDVG